VHVDGVGTVSGKGNGKSCSLDVHVTGYTSFLFFPFCPLDVGFFLSSFFFVVVVAAGHTHTHTHTHTKGPTRRVNLNHQYAQHA